MLPADPTRRLKPGPAARLEDTCPPQTFRPIYPRSIAAPGVGRPLGPHRSACPRDRAGAGRHGRRPAARWRTTEPQLAGKVLSNWRALSKTYSQMTARLSQDPRITLRQHAAIVYFTQSCAATMSTDYAHWWTCNKSSMPELHKLQQALSKQWRISACSTVNADDYVLVRAGTARTHLHTVEKIDRIGGRRPLCWHTARS